MSYVSVLQLPDILSSCGHLTSFLRWSSFISVILYMLHAPCQLKLYSKYFLQIYYCWTTVCLRYNMPIFERITVRATFTWLHTCARLALPLPMHQRLVSPPNPTCMMWMNEKKIRRIAARGGGDFFPSEKMFFQLIVMWSECKLGNMVFAINMALFARSIYPTLVFSKVR